MNARRIFETALATLVVAAINFIFITALNYGLSSNGILAIGDTVVLDNKIYVPISIENQSNKTINGILLNVPDTVTTETIISNVPLIIKQEETKISNGIKQFNLSRIQSRTETLIYIPISSAQSKKQIWFTNFRELNLIVNTDNHLKSPIMEALKDALVYVIILFIIYFVFALWCNKRADRIQGKIKIIEKNSDELKETFEEQKEALNDAKNELKTVELTYIARLADYSKELNFWRDTIRKILYERFEEKKDADKIIDNITDMLKTYSTRYALNDKNFEFIKLFADLIKKK